MRWMRGRTGQSTTEYFLLATVVAVLTAGVAMRGFIGRQPAYDKDGKRQDSGTGMLSPLGSYFEAAKAKVSGQIDAKVDPGPRK